MASASPSARSIQLLRSMGWQVDISERFNSFIKRRFDLFEFADLIAIVPDGQSHPMGILGVQATSSTNHNARHVKILSNPKAKAWIRAGGHIWIMSWGKRGPRGKRKTWEVRTEIIGADDFNI